MATHQMKTFYVSTAPWVPVSVKIIMRYRSREREYPRLRAGHMAPESFRAWVSASLVLTRRGIQAADLTMAHEPDMG